MYLRSRAPPHSGCDCPPPSLAADAKIVFPAAPMSDHGGGGVGGGGGGAQRQCRRGVTGDVELDAAMALADMAGVGPAAPATAHPVQQSQQHQEAAGEHDEEEEELASTRLSLELGKVGIQSSSCSSSSSAGFSAQRAQAPAVQAAAAAPGYGAWPGRHALTEAEKEAKRLRRVLANRESARQTILRRQAIRDELARKVAELSSQNESMKKEKETVMQEYLTLKEANTQLKEQVVAKTTKEEPAAPAAPAMDAAPPAQRAEAMPSSASPPAMPPRPSFLYASAAAPAVPVPYVWGSWPGYEHGNPVVAAPAAAAPLCPWYYPVADSRGSPPPTSYARPFQQAASGGGSGTAKEDTDDDDPCSLTLGLDVDRKIRAPSTESSGRAAVERPQGAEGGGDREKAEAAAEARKRRKELTKLKQMQPGGRPGDE